MAVVICWVAPLSGSLDLRTGITVIFYLSCYKSQICNFFTNKCQKKKITQLWQVTWPKMASKEKSIGYFHVTSSRLFLDISWYFDSMMPINYISTWTKRNKIRSILKQIRFFYVQRLQKHIFVMDTTCYISINNWTISIILVQLLQLV